MVVGNGRRMRGGYMRPGRRRGWIVLVLHDEDGSARERRFVLRERARNALRAWMRGGS